MILCHKCSGVLAGDTKETEGLSGCGCISGWVRGFEPSLNREQAIAAQKREQERKLRLNSQAVNYEIERRFKMQCPKCKKVSNTEFALPKNVLCADCAWTREENGKNSSFSSALALALAKRARAAKA